MSPIPGIFKISGIVRNDDELLLRNHPLFWNARVGIELHANLDDTAAISLIGNGIATGIDLL
jgi:hypothetical protein